MSDTQLRLEVQTLFARFETFMDRLGGFDMGRYNPEDEFADIHNEGDDIRECWRATLAAAEPERTV